MDYKKSSFVYMKVNARVSNTFSEILKDIPGKEFCPYSYALATRKKGQLMTYEDFPMILYKCILEYVPRRSENPLIKAIKKLPKAIENVQRIRINAGILEVQQNILDKYFYTHGNDNIKDKIDELKSNIDELIQNGEMDILDSVLEGFEGRMRNGLLKDMTELSRLLEQRK